MTSLNALSDTELASIAGVSLDAPLDVRNNNPGNMRSGSGFSSFDTPKAGLEAMQHDLELKVSGRSPMMKSHFGQDYQPTLRNVISTWAPPSENDTGNYINFVAKNAGIHPDQVLTTDDVPKIMQPMIHMEGGQKASDYFGKLMGSIGNAIIPPAEAQESQQKESHLSSLSDDELMKAAGIQPAPPSNGPEGFLARIGASPVGQMVGTGIDAAKDTLGNLTGMVTGQPYQEAPTPDMEALRTKGWSGTSTPEKFGAVEEALFNSPPGKLLQMTGASNAPGALAGAGLNAANQKMEEAGIPHQYSAAAEMALPFLAKAKGDVGTGLPGIIGDNTSGGPPPASQPPPAGAFNPAIPPVATAAPVTTTAAPIAPVAPNAPLFGKKPTPVLKTDSGQPLLVSPKAITQGQKDLLAFAREDGLDLNKVADDLEAAQKVNPHLTALDVMVKDVGGVQVQGKNVTGLAKSIAHDKGQGAVLAGEMVARGYKASERIGSAFDKSLSGSDFYKTKTDAIQQMEDAGPTFTEAFKANQNMMTPVIKNILTTDAGRGALEFARGRMNDRQSLLAVPDKELAEQARLVGQYVKGVSASGLKLQTLAYVKQGFDAQIRQRLQQGGDVGGLIMQKNALLNEMKKADVTATENTPGLYAQGLKNYATPAKVQEALIKGRGFMKMDAEEIRDLMNDKNISDPEKKAFTSGAGRALQDRIDMKSDSTNPVNDLWKPNLQNRLREMIPGDYDNFAQYMGHEKTMARNNNVVHGSDTATKLNFKEAPSVGGLVKAVTNPQGAMVDAGLDLINKQLHKSAKSMSQDSRAVAMRYLTTKDPQMLRDLAKQQKGKKP